MMKKYEKKMTECLYITNIKCNKCGYEVECDDQELEFQEFFWYNFMGGYSSIFGDGVVGEIELCQYCFKELLGDYIEVKGENDGQI